MSALFTKEIRSAINRRAYAVGQEEVLRLINVTRGKIALDVLKMIEDETEEDEILEAITSWKQT